MEYLGRKESTEQGIFDSMALHAADTLKPLDEPEFNYENFAKRERQWSETQGALNMAQGKINLKDFNGSELSSPTFSFGPHMLSCWGSSSLKMAHSINTWMNLQKSAWLGSNNYTNMPALSKATRSTKYTEQL